FNQVTWGCGFADFDNDGYRDLFYACGHLIDNVDQIDDSTSYLARPVLMRNLGNGKFDDPRNVGGDGLLVESVGRGAALEDLDNDGRIDVVILNSRRPPTILRNESENQNHWLQLRLRGTRTNRGGVGARVTVQAGDLTLTDEVHSGRSYQSHFGSRLHFGLGSRQRVDRVHVRWVGGGVDVAENIPANQLLTITETESQKSSQ
ncbi:MAG: CRTAC1 family protein, partial [Thermoguttaceae bacterium]